MSLEELCKKYNVSQSSVLTKFKRTQESILKKYGVNIIKVGRGASAEYLESLDNGTRALTLYQEQDNTLFYMDAEIIGLELWEFMILVALLAKPELVFRGTYKMLVEYLDKRATPANLGAIKQAIVNLKNRGHILFAEDSDEYFIIGLRRQAEKKIVDLQLDVIKKCHEIAEINHKKDWVPLTKIIAAAMYLKDREPCTVDDIKQLTGLSEYNIRESKKLLQENNLVIYHKESVSDGESVYCIGSSADINGFVI